MSDVAIRVEGIGKRYRIGARQRTYKTLRDKLHESALLPVRAMKSLVGRNGHNSRLGVLNPKSDVIWALKDVSFEVHRGEAVGIIGRNGAGKSTLLKILSRITEPTEGYADINGRVGSLLEVGTGFHAELTGRENIYLNGSILGMKRIEIQKKFDEMVAFAEIEKFIDTPVKHYSSGMYVRLAFSVAAHLEPEILLVDEVLAVGDGAFQKKCLGKMGDVAKEGRTVLFVSHNMAAARSLCQQGILLKDGILSSIGSIRKVTDEYSASGLARELVDTNNFNKPDGYCAWIESVSVQCNGEYSPILKMGDALIVDIRFRSDRFLQKPSVGLVISSVRGEKIVNANNIYQPSPEFRVPVREGRIRCKLGVVPLMGGRYSISLWFGSHCLSEHQYIEDALSFEVIERDIWGMGKLPSHRISQLWWPTAFEFSNGID